MKKSEMIKALENVIDTSLPASEIASSVLELILEKGMEPPETDVLFSREFGPGLDVAFYTKKRVWDVE